MEVHNVNMCKISWHSDDIDQLQDFTVQDVSQLVGRVLDETKATGLAWISESVTAISGMLPRFPHVKLGRRLDENAHIGAATFGREKPGLPFSSTKTTLNVHVSFWNARTTELVEGAPERLDISVFIRGRLAEQIDETNATSRFSDAAALIRNAVRPVCQGWGSMTMQELRQRCLEAVPQLKRQIAGALEASDFEVQARRCGPSETSKKKPWFTCSRPFLTTIRKAYIALGSNVGDRFAAIEHACRAIDQYPDMRILRTSSLYETEPMYVEDQDRFLNGACLVSKVIAQIGPHLLNVLQIETTLEPMELLDRLQAIEKDLGRIKLIDKGPRNIDLDILDYEGLVLDTERLTLPHRSMMEREFVLRPLVE